MNLSCKGFICVGCVVFPLGTSAFPNVPATNYNSSPNRVWFQLLLLVLFVIVICIVVARGGPIVLYVVQTPSKRESLLRIFSDWREHVNTSLLQAFMKQLSNLVNRFLPPDAFTQLPGMGAGSAACTETSHSFDIWFLCLFTFFPFSNHGKVKDVRMDTVLLQTITSLMLLFLRVVCMWLAWIAGNSETEALAKSRL